MKGKYMQLSYLIRKVAEMFETCWFQIWKVTFSAPLPLQPKSNVLHSSCSHLLPLWSSHQTSEKQPSFPMHSSHISSSIILRSLNAAPSEARAASEFNLFPVLVMIIGSPLRTLTLLETRTCAGFLHCDDSSYISVQSHRVNCLKTEAGDQTLFITSSA